VHPLENKVLDVQGCTKTTFYGEFMSHSATEVSEVFTLKSLKRLSDFNHIWSFSADFHRSSQLEPL